MKKLLLVLALVLLTTPAFARPPKKPVVINNTTNVTNVTNNTIDDESKDTVAGVKVDAPNLIEITPVWHVGVEGFKNFVNTTSQEGWGGYVKVTYSGTLLNMNKK